MKILGRKILILAVRVYQDFVSPFLGACCRFHPSCSSYFREAVRIHGLFRGPAMGAWRILRCQPFSRGGWDPVAPFGVTKKASWKNVSF